jgi:ubiquinone/menaquinone biosynthesis C-methylase UbiE
MKQEFSSPVVEAFDAWSEVYDTQPNPLLALEERVLGSMMPDVRGLDVLDAGCGTGRWLEWLVARSPRSLVGVDISPAMLLLAGIKLSHNCSLRLGSCTALPVNDTSCDMVLSSFVVSYLADLEAFAREIDRVARPGATIFLADMHPERTSPRPFKLVVLSLFRALSPPSARKRGRSSKTAASLSCTIPPRLFRRFT